MEPNAMPKIFADCLKRIRRSKRLSQSDVARMTGLMPAAISHFETGERRPSLENLQKLADALAVSVDYLLGREVARATSASGKLLRDFERLSLKDQEVISDMAKLLLKKSPKP